MLITGRSPFAYGGAGEILARIMDGKYHCPPHVSEKCRKYVRNIMHRAGLGQVGRDRQTDTVVLIHRPCF